MGISIKENIYNLSNNTNEDLYIKNSRGTPIIYNMQKSYLNSSSINQTSSNGINSQILLMYLFRNIAELMILINT